MIFEGLQLVQLNNITTQKSGSYKSIAYLNKKIKEFIDNYYTKYGFKYGLNNIDINVNGLIIDCEYISKMVNNYTVFKSIIRINGLKTEDEFYNFMFTNLSEIYLPDGRFFKNTLDILFKTTKIGNKNEALAINFFEELLKSKGIDVRIISPTVDEDISGIDGKFTWNGRDVTIQIKPFISTNIIGNRISIESQGSLSIGTDYLILYKDNSYIVTRGKETSIESKYFITDLDKIIKNGE